MSLRSRRPSRPSRPRAVLASLCVAALALSGSALVGSPAEAAIATSTISIGVSPTTVQVGQTAVVRGTLKRASRAYAEKRVVLQSRVAGSARWSKVLTQETNRRGVAEATTPALTQTSQLRWRYAGDRTTKPSVSKTVTARVTIPGSEDWILVDDWTRSTAPDARLLVTGRTGPALVDEVLFLQGRAPGGTAWDAAGTARVDATGHFAIDSFSPHYGNVELRILHPDATKPPVPVGTVEVFQYVGSSGVTWLDEENLYTTTTRTVNGVPYSYTWANADAKEMWSVWAPKTVGWATVLAGKVAVEDGTGAVGDQKAFRVTVWNNDGTTTVTNLGPTTRGAEPIPFRVDISRATKFEIRILAGGGGATGFFTHLGVLYTG